MGPTGLRRVSANLALVTLALGGLVMLAPASGTAGTTVSETTPFVYDGTNMCTGDVFTGTGTMHFLESANLSASGALQYHLDVRIDGLQAVTPTGKRYIVADTFDHQFSFGGAAEDTFDLTAHFVRVGEDGGLILGDDFYEYIRAHITANANGTVTADYVRTNSMS